MLDSVRPTYKASVSPELVHLLRGDIPKKRQADMLAQNSTRPKRVVSANAPIWAPVKLRRDGERPFYGKALLICAYEDDVTVQFEDGPLVIRKRIGVYLQPKQKLIVHLSYHPPNGYPTRPVYRVVQPETADDLSAVLNQFGPEDCFLVSGQPVARLSAAASLPLPLPRLGQSPIPI